MCTWEQRLFSSTKIACYASTAWLVLRVCADARLQKMTLFHTCARVAKHAFMDVPRWRASSVALSWCGSRHGRGTVEDCNSSICNYLRHHVVATWQALAHHGLASVRLWQSVSQHGFRSFQQLRGCRIAGWVSAKATCCLCILLPAAIVALTTVTIRNDKTARLRNGCMQAARLFLLSI